MEHAFRSKSQVTWQSFTILSQTEILMSHSHFLRHLQTPVKYQYLPRFHTDLEKFIDPGIPYWIGKIRVRSVAFVTISCTCTLPLTYTCWGDVTCVRIVKITIAWISWVFIRRRRRKKNKWARSAKLIRYAVTWPYDFFIMFCCTSFYTNDSGQRLSVNALRRR